MRRVAAIWIGCMIDLGLGDPEHWWHPVRAMGRLTQWLEARLRPRFAQTPGGERCAGSILTVLVLAATGLCGSGALLAAGLIHPFLQFVLMCVICWQTVAVRSLKTESMKVCRRLEAGDTEAARAAVSRIVGRDTAVLDEAGIMRAAVETVAENTSDGVIAPLFWLFAAGPVGGLLYKAVNTMDSMIGYRNDRYLWFGRTAAKLDDLVNWLPARISAFLLTAAAFLWPDCDGKGAYRIWRRDRRKHASPNSAQGEAACAGALGVRLAGDAWYFGELHKKPTIGDDNRPVEAEDIRRVNRLMMTASALAVLGGTAAAVAVSAMAARRKRR